MSFTPLVLTDAEIYLDGADLTGYSNSLEAKATRAVLEKTTFADSGWRTRTGGLFDGDVAIRGFWQAGDSTQPDDVFWADLGVASIPLTALPSGGVVGDTAYVTRIIESAYTPGATVGQLLGWTVDLKSNWPIARGQILHPQGTARTTTGTGTALQLGALSATQALYVNLHVMSYVDGSLTVAIQSDDNSGFTSAATQGTFTAATAVGGQTMKISGAVTDNYWRASWTISGGSTHSFLFAVSAGIGPK